jgi:hypothetical protein
VAAVLEAGSAIVDVEVALDGTAVVLSDEAAGSILLLDIGTWSVVDITPCKSPAGLVQAPGYSSRFWIGCLDGTVLWVEIKDGEVAESGSPVTVSGTAVLGLTASADTLFVLMDSPTEGAAPQLHMVSFSDGAVDAGSGYPSAVGATGFEDIAYSGTGVYVTHGGTQITRVEGGSGAATLQQQTVSGAATGDILPLPGVSLLVAGGSAGVLSYEASANRLLSLLNADDGISEATAMAIDLSQGFFLVADGGTSEVLRYGASTTSGFPSGDPVDRLDYPSDIAQISEMGVIDGYVIAGTSDGKAVVLTDRPWVEVQEAQPGAALSGTEVTVDFVSDIGGTWEARLNGSSNEDGERLAKGSIDPDQIGTASFTVDDGFREGTNRIRVIVTDSDGAKGHDTSLLSVDNPPSRVGLNSGDVGWGDGLIKVAIRGISDEDLSHYEVFVSAEEFSAGEYPTGGPGFEGAAGDRSGSRLNLPRKVSAEPGQDKNISIAPLTNGVTYYVAVRATDAAGQEGQMSKVVSVMPQETYGAADLAGEKGGFGCSSSGRGAGGVLALIGLLSLAFRRAPAAAAGLLLVLSLPAQAQSEWPQAVKGWSQIKGQTFEIRYGPITFEDEAITSVFGDEGNNMTMIQFGPTIYDLVEIKGSIGYFHGEATRVSASGASSSQEDALNLYPVALDITGRLDVLPEQPVVPFAGAGVDYFFWREVWEGSGGGGDGTIKGGKPGWHQTYGAHILLDTFDQPRASRLQAVTGITDSYITVEYRTQKIGEELSGLKFSAETLTFGLKFDH